jgi:hypothetical protein
MEEGTGAKFTSITYGSDQARWDYEMIGLGRLVTAKGFVLHVCGGWVFDIRFSKVIWTEVDKGFERATRDMYELWERREREEEEKGWASERETEGKEESG